MERASIFYFIYDHQWRFTRWSKSFEVISGYDAKEISRMHPLDFYMGEEKEIMKRKIEKVFSGGSEETTAHLYTKDKRKIPYYFNSHKLTLNGGNYLIGVGIDITERSKAESDLISHLEQVREEERTRIAREIHDELGQQLTGLKMDAAWLSKKIGSGEIAIHEKLVNMISLMDNAVQTIRRIASDLRPSILDDLGLIAALEWQSAEFARRTNVRSIFTSNVSELIVDRQLATGVFRIYQETLTNIMRHAFASRVEARLEKKSADIILTIVDDGKGFDTAIIDGNESLGLIGMYERATRLGITLKVTSEPGTGTQVFLKFPLGSPV
ncbi:MAG: PAS domain-containing sensor histidine kinase [Bacteroidetes bacterium]|nr:PAS domain-containing sensor histidine kinase [Bacteroidota bacterium]